MPRSVDLPEDLTLLARRNALEIRLGHFPTDSARLFDAVEQALENARVEPQSKQIEKSETEPQQPTISPPKGTEGMAQGEETVTIRYTFKVDAYTPATGQRVSSGSGEFSATWNEIFSLWAPVLMSEAPESTLKLWMDRLARNKKIQEMQAGGLEPYEFRIEDHDFQKIKFQLRSLGLIEISQKPKEAYDEARWTLMPYGERYAMTSLAIFSGRKSNG